MKKVLFICTKNACRSQMAEAIVNHELSDRFQAVSAGTSPTQPNPMALKVLSEIGIDHSGSKSNHLDDFKDWEFEYVISLCDNADKNCPVFLGGTKRTHIGFENPDAAEGSEEERLVAFRRVRDQIRQKIPACLTDEANGE